MGDRINNMGKMMNNPKQRNQYLAIGGIAIVTVVAGFWYNTRSHGPIQPGGGAQLPSVPVVNTVPGSSTNPDYNKKVLENNQEQAKKALATNGSFQSTVTNQSGMNSDSPLDLIEKQRQQKEAEDKAKQAQLDAQQVVTPPVVVAQPVVQPVVQTVSQPAPVKKKYGAEDYMLIATLSNNWKNKAPASEFDFTKDKAGNNGSGAEANQAANAASNATSVQSAPPLAKAGTIFNAILETAINSDEPSPVLAKIISGPLKGTRLIGSIQNSGNQSDKVVVQFTTASIPNYANSVKLSAVAVDPDTTRSALASDVNHHYFEKYGILLASSFLSGYATAISRENTTTTVGPLGNVTQVQGQLDSGQVNKQALGNVGTALANTAQQNIQNIKTTIKVDGGSAIGILLMDDLKVSQN